MIMKYIKTIDLKVYFENWMKNFEPVEVYIYDLDFNLLDIVQWQPLACQVF